MENCGNLKLIHLIINLFSRPRLKGLNLNILK